MVSLATPSPLDRILSEHVKNLSNLVLGASGYGQRVQLTRYSDATNYANTLGNTDTTNGRALKVQYGDPDGSPVTLATFQKSSTRIQSNDGTDYIDVSNSGVAVTGTFTVNGATVGAGLTVYNVLDNNVTEGTGTTYAGANTTALQTLWTTAATAGGGIIYFPPGDYSFNATTLNHAQGTGATKAITIRGAGGSSIVKFYGSTGPYLTIASTASSPVAQCGLEDLYINHGQYPSSGATIVLGYTSRYHIRNVSMTGNEAFIGLSLTASASVHVQNSTITVQNVANAVCVDFTQSLPTGGVQFTGCDISGDSSATTGAWVTRGIRFNNSAIVDTVVLNGTSVKDHLYGIVSAANVGDVANFQMNGGFLDQSNYNVVVNPTSTGTSAALTAAYYGWFFGNVWMSAETQNVSLATTNGGTLSGFSFVGGYMTNATQGAIKATKACDVVRVMGVQIAAGTTNNASYAGVEFEADSGTSPSNVAVTGCYIATGTTAAACIKTSSGATPILFANNILRGSADADGIVDGGATSASRVITANAYLA